MAYGFAINQSSMQSIEDLKGCRGVNTGVAEGLQGGKKGYNPFKGTPSFAGYPQLCWVPPALLGTPSFAEYPQSSMLCIEDWVAP
jgi:hypothetical protein